MPYREGLGGAGKARSRRHSNAISRLSNAASGVQELKTNIEEGDLVGALYKLNEIKALLKDAQENVNQIPEVVKFAGLHDQVAAMAERIEELAAREGWPDFLVPTGEAKEDETPEKAMKRLADELEEVKRSMAFMQKLMDEMRYKPVVEEVLLAVE